MSADDEEPESEGEEKGSYGLLWRVILFVFIVGPASVFAFGIYARIGVKASLMASLERGSYSFAVVLLLWLLGMIGTAVMIFKK